MPKNTYDLAVIGSGPASGAVVTQAIRHKSIRRIAVIDSLFGGTCALRGCTPKRLMETVATVSNYVHNLRDLGFGGQNLRASWEGMIRNQARLTATIPHQTKANWREQGVEIITGKAKFQDERTLAVDDRSIVADRIVIATGAFPTPLPIDGAEHLNHSRDFFELVHLPDPVVFVGGGYIGFELAHIVAATGRSVTIVSKDEIPLPHFDPELVASLLQNTYHQGVAVKLGWEAKAIRKDGDQNYRVCIERSAGGNEIEIPAGIVFHSAGRSPRLADLQLDKASLDYDKQEGIRVDEYLRTNQQHIYALGDVIGSYPFTPVAERESNVVAHNLTSDDAKKIEYGQVPQVLFANPRLARIGALASELDAQGIAYETHAGNSDDYLVEKIYNAEGTRYKLLLGKEDGKILGVHLFGSRAEEVINLFALAMRHEIKMDGLKDLVYAFPTATHSASNY